MAKVLGVFASYVELNAWMLKVLKDHQVTIASSGKIIDGKNIKPLTKKEITEGNIDFIKMPTVFNNKLDYIIRFFYLLFSLPKFSMSDYKLVIFFSPPFFLSTLSPLFRIFGIKTSIYVSDDWVESAIYQRGLPKIPFFKTILRSIEFFSVKNMNHVFVVCEHLKRLYRPFNRNITIAPTSVDVSRIDGIKPKRISKGPVVVYLGAMFEYKGVLLLAKAFKVLKKGVKNVKLLMIGSGPALKELEKIRNGDEDIILAGSLDYDDAIALTKGAGVAVLPFKKITMNWTGSPQKFFDYMASGVPMVYTGGGGQHPIFIKKYGVGIEADDTVDDLADKITVLLKDTVLRRRLRANCLKNRSKIDYRNLFKPYIKTVNVLVE